MAPRAEALPEVGPAPPPPYPAGRPRFSPGDAVKVSFRDGPGHIRTPWYIRGRTGRVERVCGAFPNPEELAARRDGLPALPLYRVRFALAALWGAGAAQDTLDVELYEHWLEPADAA
ncbi:SH3-like domain-containing protein [Rubrimonas cliftonensis]|uniref:Nitrile hydratase n=1 Tax=Rubrimonas cliftonensis TaxID=89524 RepID=A0A1H3W0P6_9RHOB|nr:SH3-like domain-containing protein [Rubrimonas cliftonensis]SDZ79888.1 nitrile hydratase [Rubrimonas cliftonensis]